MPGRVHIMPISGVPMFYECIGDYIEAVLINVIGILGNGYEYFFLCCSKITMESFFFINN